MKILFLSRWFPYPPDNGAKIRIYHLLEALSTAHTVDLISFCSEPVGLEKKQNLLSFCRSVETVVYQPFQATRVKALIGFITPGPRFLFDTYHKELENLIASKMSHEVYDVIIASEIDMTPYASVIQGPAKIFEEIEISQALDPLADTQSHLSVLRKYLTWWKLLFYLRTITTKFDGFTTVSQKELQKLARISELDGKVRVIPNGMESAKASSELLSPVRDTIIYAGSLTYQANFDAVEYFLREIFPLIKQKRPNVKFFVTGKLDGVDLSQLPRGEDVIFTGYLNDVTRLVSESWASVVPLRIGGGTRLKILESLGLGTPVISTSKGMEGLDLVPGRDILVGDDANTFADQVVSVLENESLRWKLGQAGCQVVNQKYNWKDIGADFCAYVENIVSKRTVY